MKTHDIVVVPIIVTSAQLCQTTRYMVPDWVLVLVGLTLLVGGGEALVRGACGVAILAKVRPAVVGVTIVAAGTSMPEFVVSVRAAVAGSPGLAIGNVVGSNIFNIGVVLGLTALVRPLQVQNSTLRFELPVMMLAAVQLVFLSHDRSLSRLEGGIFLATLLAFTVSVVRFSNKARTPMGGADSAELATASFGHAGAAAWGANLGAVLLGAGLLASGAAMLVRGASGIAASIGLTEAMIGLTVVAAGTSTPELITSLVAVHRGRDDLAVGNVVGSNIFNVLGILGATALIHPLTVPEEIATRDYWWMLCASALLLPLMQTKRQISRLEGALLLIGFLAYFALLQRSS